MPKNSKVTQREHSSEHVTESVADLLALEEPVDYKQSILNVAGEAGGKQKAAEEELDAEDRPAWNSKLQYILAQIGFSVGLGNIWRFPYLCQKNGGGAYLVPYLVLLIIIGIPLFFLELAVGQRIRRGSIGVWHYVCPRLGGIGFSSCILDKMLDPQVWREAATQVFFALGLGFGGVIAFSSYNKQDNNCHFDAALVSFINFFTSVLATLVVFAVLGFKANIMNEKCVVENAEKILGYLHTNVLSRDLIPPHVNFSHLTAKDYTEMYKVIMAVKEDHFSALGLDPCLLEDELDKSVQGTGLAFIAFTEAMTHFPASPFWSVMFFLMLINLGLGSMIGTMAGITTPIIDTFKVPKEMFTVGCCVFAFFVGLLFVQRSGNYFVTMFDDYSATLPLTVIVILENIAVAWIYGTKKFMQELTEMLGFRPYRFYFYMWKFVSPLCMAVLTTASIIQLGVTPPGYSAWIKEEAAERYLYFPNWAMALLITLIVVATLPIPVVFILRHFHLLSDGSNTLSVSYKKGRMMKDISNLEENDETRFILSKVLGIPPCRQVVVRGSASGRTGCGAAQRLMNSRLGTGRLCQSGLRAQTWDESCGSPQVLFCGLGTGALGLGSRWNLHVPDPAWSSVCPASCLGG
uniref:Transporter n=1 Tax=Felis catus TaxID=9685 RepID=A0ABI7YD20_FELCA